MQYPRERNNFWTECINWIQFHLSQKYSRRIADDLLTVVVSYCEIEVIATGSERSALIPVLHPRVPFCWLTLYSPHDGSQFLRVSSSDSVAPLATCAPWSGAAPRHLVFPVYHGAPQVTHAAEATPTHIHCHHL